MLQAPALLSERHALADFSCGRPVLDDWLRKRARANQTSGASRTYVVTDDVRVVAYYCLAAGGLAAAEATGAFRRNMPDPVPVAVLGRLAVDRSMQGKGLGVALLRDCVLRASQAADIMGIRGIIVHALDGDAKAFYERYGFSASPQNPLLLVLSLKRPS
ncbi:MAG: GNAT family N-acetyltransferase [Alphaproteobacteria bacterium]